MTDPHNEPSSTPRIVADAILHIFGVRHRAEFLRDLQDEIDGRSGRKNTIAIMLWAAWQTVGVVFYHYRDAGLGKWLKSLHPVLALGLATRSLRRDARAWVLSSLTLAVGFGATAAIYSVLRGFGGPIPVENGDQLVRVVARESVSRLEVMDPRIFSAWEQASTPFEALGAFETHSVVMRRPDGAPRRISSAAVTPGVLPMLGVRPLAGRLPQRSDPDPEDQVVLGYEAWTLLFERNPAVGAVVNVDGIDRTVVAVMPEGFRFPFQQNAWVPVPDDRVSAGFEITGLIAERRRESARSQLESIARGFALEDPGSAAGVDVEVMGFTEKRGEGGETVALVGLLVIVLSLLVVSAANVSNMLLVRATSRARTLAVHSALGASPQQVLLQMFTEAIVMALSGAAAGLGVAWAIVRVVEDNLSNHWGYYWMKVEIDPAVVVFTMLVACGVAVIAGTVPAVHAMKRDTVAELRREAGRRHGRRTAQWVLLTGQVSFSVVALIISSLMATGLASSNRLYDRFPAASVKLASVTTDGPRYETPEARQAFETALSAQLAGTQGVSSFTLTSGMPGLFSPMASVESDNGQAERSGESVRARVFPVAGDYFEVFNMGILAGRGLNVTDQSASDAPAAVVSRSLAGGVFGSDDPVGRRIKLEGIGPQDWYRVVGVVEDLRMFASSQNENLLAAYVPLGATDAESFYIAYTGTAETADIGRVIWSLDPDLPIEAGIFGDASVRTVEDVIGFVRILFTIVGTLSFLGGIGAVLVACFGLYGVVSFDVRTRTREIGIRMALGARRTSVLKRFVREGLGRIVPGLVIGSILAFTVAPLFGVFLSGVDPRNPAVFAVALVGFGIIAAAAALLPARQAASVDPVRVLKTD